MKTKLPKPAAGTQLALVIREHEDYGYYHIIGRLAVIRPNSEGCHDTSDLGGVRYGDFSGDDEYSLRGVDQSLQHIAVRCQGGGQSRDNGVYAWQVCFEDLPGTMDADDMRISSAVIDAIEKRVAAEKAKFGTCATYGQFVARVARALGCSVLLFPAPNGKREWANGYNFLARSLPDGAASVDNLVHDWQQATMTA